MSLKLGLPSGSLDALPEAAELLVIGSGIMGLATAYHAARLGLRNIVVIDRGYLCSGASGRNGGGVRMQWSTEDNINLMQESVDICRSFAKEMGFNVWFRQGGYLFLVKDPALVSVLEANVLRQNACGVPTQMFEPKQAKELVPQLDTRGVICASYNPRDGVLFPWPFLWGYAHRALELGVKIYSFVNAERLEIQGQKVVAVQTSRGRIRTQHVLNATGAWTPKVAALAGLSFPNQPYRHEILTTEPLKPFLTPMVTVLGEGIYFSQSMRGEIVGGMGDPDEPSSEDISSSLGFIRRFARAATQLVPLLANVQVVRQWAGLYDMPPDGRPILGESQAVQNLTHLAGFAGHGFMMAPIIGKLCAERLVKSTTVPYFDQNGPDRFRDGVVVAKESMTIG